MPRPIRSVLTAVLVAAPAIAVAVSLTLIEIARVLDPASSLFGEPPARSLAEAIMRGRNVEEAYSFIRAGQDPNAPITVSGREYAGDHPRTVSPLVLAVAAQDDNVVAMLLSYGARRDLPQNRVAWCVARAMGDDETAALIAGEDARNVPAACAPSTPGMPRLAPVPVIDAERSAGIANDSGSVP